MSDNRNAGWRGRHGWGESNGSDGSFGSDRYRSELWDRRDATGYNPAGAAQGGYGPEYDRYRAERGNREDRGYDAGRDYGVEWSDQRGSRYAGGGRYGEDQYGEGAYTPYGQRHEADHAYTRRRPDYRGSDRGGYGYRQQEDRSFVGHNEYVEAVTDGATGSGEHRGRGPKGYRRSDERIREDINDRLTEDAWLDASNIEVAVSDGEVTLSGVVDSRQAKRRAEDLAERVSGVGDVQNQLRVNRNSQSEINDQTSASTI